MNQKTKIFICDDIKHIIDYFSMIIEKDDTLEVVGSATNAYDAVALINQTVPDIVLMDIQMESATAGIAATEQIKTAHPEIKVIIITVHEEDELLFQAYGAGAEEYILKTATPESILKSIHDVKNNVLSLRPEISYKLLREFSRLQKAQGSMLFTINVISKLTNAEIDIIKLLNAGYTRKEIAQKRYVELVTINSQISTLLKKFGCSTTKKLIKNLKELGIFSLLSD